ncbi:TetR/AcrR family transcriptional regulator [Pseudomonas sp. PAMC 29040]|uniref:TetR/AcrR family transcriptional regulator n=1 Tax=Pseudomonas sp. PAMC 29040 TaxID=2498450 RepID=UPI000FB87112|nr:TetR/AcrR family transcriptional regulator [Pseudomonas sp. PAMC 29040]RUT42314.1 TetR/AcrR family transcriptional regulator [Pseudomonas sp. PAMC 29040]
MNEKPDPAAKPLKRSSASTKTKKQTGSAADRSSSSAEKVHAETHKPRINEKVRLRTRTKLLSGARIVMGRKGIEATAINDITEEAGVSFGSFYNYFSSKEEIARAVFIDDALRMIEELDEATSPTAGIAEVVGINIRRTVHRGLTDPVWGWFLVHSVYSINDMIETMGIPLARDINAGNDTNVFKVGDVVSTVDCIIGGMLYLLRKILEGARPVSAVESLVQYILAGLGVEHEEVERIIHIDLSTYGES